MTAHHLASWRLHTTAALLLLAACTDPRARPVAPIVQISLSPSFKLKSPGTLFASLYMFSSDGLKSVDLSIRSADSTLKGDSTVFLTGDAEITRPLDWTVPKGIPIGTAVTLIARVQAFTAFVAADTILLSVQDTI